MDVQLAQVNITRMRAPLSDPVMWGFVRRAAAVNVQAEAAPGFVWRIPDDSGTEAVFGPLIMANLSVWESLDALRAYLYGGLHLDAMKLRRNWFDSTGLAAHVALWWIPRGHLPTLEEGRTRLAKLAAEGPGPHAFTLTHPQPPPTPAHPPR